jgi:hypothetical protein
MLIQAQTDVPDDVSDDELYHYFTVVNVEDVGM